MGKSGTGKSFKASQVAHRFRIDLIIDDGLLIHGQKIIAGRSAKREKGILSAIKTAVFANPDQIEEVRRALDRASYSRVLVIGTSRKMIQRIASTLGLLPIHRVITIEEVSTREEIARALKIRAEQGKHIIPVPGVEIKRNYPHIFFESVKILLKEKPGCCARATRRSWRRPWSGPSTAGPESRGRRALRRREDGHDTPSAGRPKII